MHTVRRSRSEKTIIASAAHLRFFFLQILNNDATKGNLRMVISRRSVAGSLLKSNHRSVCTSCAGGVAGSDQGVYICPPRFQRIEAGNTLLAVIRSPQDRPSSSGEKGDDPTTLGSGDRDNPQADGKLTETHRHRKDKLDQGWLAKHNSHSTLLTGTTHRTLPSQTPTRSRRQ